MKVLGKPRRRVDGRAKVTGQTRFADDIVLPRMLHMRLLRSPHPHAKVVSIDFSKAKAHPGVHLVLTGKDFPVTFGILPVSQDEYPLAPRARALRRRSGGGGGGEGRADGRRSPGPHRGEVRTAEDHFGSGGGAAEPRAAHPRLQRARQHPSPAGVRVRRCRRIPERFPSGFRGPVLLRGQHASADRAARIGRGGGRRGQAHAVVLDPGSALCAPRARARAADARDAHTSHRHAQWRRLRRQVRRMQSRDGRGEGRVDARPAGEGVPQSRGSVLHAPRPPSGADEVPHRRDQGRQAHRHAPADAGRRRRLRQLRGGEHVLYRRAADRDLRSAALQVRGGARVHQQAAVRSQARPWHAAAALRPGSAARQDRREARRVAGRAAAWHGGEAQFAHRQLAEGRNHWPRAMHP